MLDGVQWAQIRQMKHDEQLTQREIHRRTGIRVPPSAMQTALRERVPMGPM